MSMKVSANPGKRERRRECRVWTLHVLPAVAAIDAEQQ